LNELEGDVRRTGGGALAGIRVADFSRVLAGPYATMLLGDLGADVIKVEPPEGDETRRWGPPFAEDGTATYYLAVNRNKRSVVLDLRDPLDRARARRLAERADVMVENFRPGVAERFGLGFDDLAEANPGLVYCSLSGFGHAGGADRPGYDFLVQAVGGLMSVTGTPDGPPLKVGVALVDVLAGLHAAVGIVAALHRREVDGRGQRVDVSLLGSLLAALVNQASAVLEGGVVPGRLGNRHPSIAPYETLETADGPLAVAVGNDRQFRALAGVLGLPALADDPRFHTNAARVAHRDELATVLEEALARADRATWERRLREVGVPAGPILDIAAAFELAGALGLDPVAVVAGRRTPASPLGLSADPPTYRLPPPALDADGPTLRAWLDAEPG